MTAMPPQDDPQYTSRKPALVTYEEVMKISGRLDLIAHDLKPLSRLPETVAALDRRIQTQEQSMPAWGVKLNDKVHELELTDARAQQAGSTWKDALTWANTALILLFGAASLYLSLHH